MQYLQQNWGEAWSDFFDSQKILLQSIDELLFERSKSEIIFPRKENIFRAFSLTNPSKISVVILGQDPYHGDNEAMGLSFSVPNGVKIPPSLRNIFKELSADTRKEIPQNGDLTFWAKQNVLLLNSILTVAKDKPASHSKLSKDYSWQDLTDNVISYLSGIKNQKVFVLWGNFAKTKIDLIDQTHHKIICSAHPSPFSANRGFLGSNPFSQINDFLRESGQREIKW